MLSRDPINTVKAAWSAYNRERETRPSRVSEQYKLVHDMLKRMGQVNALGGLPPFSVITDYDHTFFVPGYERLCDPLLNELGNRSIPLMHMTGNDFNLLMEKNTRNGLNYKPAVVIGAVGTEIMILGEDGTYREDLEWIGHLRDTLGFSYQKAYSYCLEVKAKAAATIPNAELEFQPRDSQENINVYGYPVDRSSPKQKPGHPPPPEPFKISFRFNGSENIDAVLTIFQKELRSLSNINIVLSYDSTLSNGELRYNVDILPVTKCDAVSHVLEKCNSGGVVCGDSGNDVSTLTNTTDPNIILRVAVSGSRDNLLEEMRKLHHVAVTRQLFLTGNQKMLLIDDDDSRKGPQSISYAIEELSRIFNITWRNS